MVVGMLHGQCIHAGVVAALSGDIATVTGSEVLVPVTEPLIASGYTRAKPTSNAGPMALSTNTPEAANASRSGHGQSMTPAITTLEVTTANKITPPNPTPVLTPTPCLASSNASGMSGAGIVAIFGVVSSIQLSCIAVWQGFCYPRREHKSRMKKQDAKLRMIVVQRKTAEARALSPWKRSWSVKSRMLEQFLGSHPIVTVSSSRDQ
ncbi:hypothetical protein FRB94_007316 [Tulasnella sp. JGI-2019a]|nr:hypothetical protein FRB94_007316 [Tulasnella sp. JGI-2019a]